MTRNIQAVLVAAAVLSAVFVQPDAAAEETTTRLAAISSAGRGFVAFTTEEDESTRIVEVDGLNVVGEWQLPGFRVRSLQPVNDAGAFLARGVPRGTEEQDHFITRLYSSDQGEISLKWTSESLPPEIYRSAAMGVSEDGQAWYAARATKEGLKLVVGTVGGDSPDWQSSVSLGGHAPVIGVYFLGDDSSRLLIEQDGVLFIVERGRDAPRVLPRPSECRGGVSRARFGRDAVWANCDTFPTNELEHLNEASFEESREWLAEYAKTTDGQDFYVVYPLGALDSPIVFGAAPFFAGDVTTLWVSREAVAMVDGKTGVVKGLLVDSERGKVIPSGVVATLDGRFVSGAASTSAPFSDVGGSGNDVLVDLDDQGGVLAVTSLTQLGLSSDGP
ncbi:MAG: hypothetical protein OES32_00875 [Acidobacteriota bacterium]|nr:hypothetical protein [Acidobacteriota bacterium]